MLNLACGTRMHRAWNNVDFSPYARLARRPALAWLLRVSGFLSEERKQRLAEVDPQIVAWDLRQGVPFAPETFDVVYHSHFLEHIERRHALGLLQQCHRALKPGGVLRVVVPDLELLVNEYLAAVQAVDADRPAATKLHHQAVANIIDQMVRQEASGTKAQKRWVRWVEQKIRGGAAETGELHRWMYDRHSLGQLLAQAGFCDVRRQSANTSLVSGWAQFELDTNADGSIYKPESLYMEGIK